MEGGADDDEEAEAALVAATAALIAAATPAALMSGCGEDEEAGALGPAPTIERRLEGEAAAAAAEEPNSGAPKHAEGYTMRQIRMEPCTHMQTRATQATKTKVRVNSELHTVEVDARVAFALCVG